jgi:hypothetical protein
MKKLLLSTLVLIFSVAIASAQSNKIVFGPLEGDTAAVLTVHNGEHIEIEMWIYIDIQNASCIVGLANGLLTEDAIIAERNGAVVDPYYDEPYWESVWVDGPFVNNPDDPFAVPEGYSCEILCALSTVFGSCDSIIHILPDTGWVYYGSFFMVCNENVPAGETYYPLSMGWYPHSGQGTSWSFMAPPGGSVVPEQDYCGLYFDEITVCDYIPGDCDHNGVPLELADVSAMINSYRGIGEPPFQCDCGWDPLRPGFAATADPNGNCVPNELNDVVTEIGAYRGVAEVSGCPDCPGSDRLLIEQEKD